jgi:XTP/dITP diphosphohydrolase
MTGSARPAFVCALVLLRHADDPTPIIAEGAGPAASCAKERGAGGFGYDPLFFRHQPRPERRRTRSGDKNAISHRGIACRALLARLAAQ